VPLIQLPINPGKNITVIIEVVALNYLLKQYSGYVAAEALEERIKTSIDDEAMMTTRFGSNYLTKDYE